jgi:hypothetical protein
MAWGRDAIPFPQDAPPFAAQIRHFLLNFQKAEKKYLAEFPLLG